MAPGRVYRDYYTEKHSYEVSPRRSASLKEVSEPPDTPRTAVLVAKGRDNGVNGDDHAGYATGIAETTGEDENTFYESDFSEPILSQDQMDLGHVLNDNTTALPIIPHNIQKSRGPTSPQPSFSRPRDSTSPQPSFSRPREYMSPSPPPRATNRPSQLLSPAQTRPYLKEGTPAPLSRGESESMAKMPEFFSPTVFHTVLSNPTISHQLLKFGQARMCGESIEFLGRVNRYHKLLEEVTKSISDIHGDFLSEGASLQLNVPYNVLARVNSDVKSSLASAMPRLETIFGSAQTDVEQLVYGDVYPSFVRHQMTVSAAKALGNNRQKYAGLGDCFVLTDPAKADNPIVFASDGFVKVTGYSRNEIIPRNCRFLQGANTEQASVSRLRDAIAKREESVELLLNQTKEGEPFWNLLYTTPLFDSNGKLVFFLGGQINCSTTIHSTSDVLRILAQSEDKATPAEEARQQKPKLSKSRRLFRTNSRTAMADRTPGMEDGLLDKLESMPIQGQFKTFHTAYSNVSDESRVLMNPPMLILLQFIIVNYSTMLIAFISTGIVEMLFPIKAKQQANHGQAAGTDIFKFLANHGTGSLNWDFKSQVKGALKSGQAVSLDIKLCAKPYMGFEKFVCHWTPLKDEKGAVAWVVLTLGSDQRL